MKILYFIVPLWIFVALALFVQNSISQANNQFDTYKQTEDTSPERQPDHRGSGRRHMKVDKS